MAIRICISIVNKLNVSVAVDMMNVHFVVFMMEKDIKFEVDVLMNSLQRETCHLA